MLGLVFGDPHIKITELKVSQEMINAILRVAQEKNPDFIVCLGDTLDRHEIIHTEPLVIATKFLADLSDIAPLYLIIGNHDRINNSDYMTERHPFYALKKWKNVTVVDTTRVVEIQGMKFFFAPYVFPGKFHEALEGFNIQECKAGFAHQEIYGTKMGCVVSIKGDKWPLDYPLLITGHIHDRCSPQQNVLYIGTPRQINFDEECDKTISLFSFEDKIKEERISLGLPQKVVVKLTPDQFSSFKPPSNSQLKVIIEGSKAELQAAMKLEKIKEFRKQGIKVLSKEIQTKVIPRIRDKKFRDRLYERVKNDVSLRKMYFRIFGKKIIIKRN